MKHCVNRDQKNLMEAHFQHTILTKRFYKTSVVLRPLRLYKTNLVLQSRLDKIVV